MKAVYTSRQTQVRIGCEHGEHLTLRRPRDWKPQFSFSGLYRQTISVYKHPTNALRADLLATAQVQKQLQHDLMDDAHNLPTSAQRNPSSAQPATHKNHTRRRVVTTPQPHHPCPGLKARERRHNADSKSDISHGIAEPEPIDHTDARAAWLDMDASRGREKGTKGIKGDSDSRPPQWRVSCDIIIQVPLDTDTQVGTPPSTGGRVGVASPHRSSSSSSSSRRSLRLSYAARRANKQAHARAGSEAKADAPTLRRSVAQNAAPTSTIRHSPCHIPRARSAARPLTRRG